MSFSVLRRVLVRFVVVVVVVTVNKRPDKINIEDEKSIFAPGFRGSVRSQLTR